MLLEQLEAEYPASYPITILDVPEPEPANRFSPMAPDPMTIFFSPERILAPAPVPIKVFQFPFETLVPALRPRNTL